MLSLYTILPLILWLISLLCLQHGFDTFTGKLQPHFALVLLQFHACCYLHKLPSCLKGVTSLGLQAFQKIGWVFVEALPQAALIINLLNVLYLSSCLYKWQKSSKSSELHSACRLPELASPLRRRHLTKANKAQAFQQLSQTSIWWVLHEFSAGWTDSSWFIMQWNTLPSGKAWHLNPLPKLFGKLGLTGLFLQVKGLFNESIPLFLKDLKTFAGDANALRYHPLPDMNALEVTLDAVLIKARSEPDARDVVLEQSGPSSEHLLAAIRTAKFCNKLSKSWCNAFPAAIYMWTVTFIPAQGESRTLQNSPACSRPGWPEYILSCWECGIQGGR